MTNKKNGLRLLIAGHHELGAKALAAILESGIEATYIAEQTPARGRGESLREVGDRFGVRPIEDKGDMSLAAAIFKYQPDVLLSCGYRRIITKPVLDRVPFPINVHFGELPRYRGCWSVPWAIMNGEAHIGVTLHRMSPGIDNGPIYSQSLIEDDGTLSCKALYLKAVDAGVDLILKWLEQVRHAIVPAPVPQNEALATYFGMRYPNDFRINWRATILQVSRYIRASYFPPYLPAYSKIGKSQKIYFHWPVRLIAESHGIATGAVVQLLDGNFGVGVLNGFVIPGRVSLDNLEDKPFSELVTEKGWKGFRFE